jgi:hypothetical protein
MFRRFNFGAIACGDIGAKKALAAADAPSGSPMGEFDYGAKAAGDGDAVIGVSGIVSTPSGKTVEITTEGIVPVIAGERLLVGDAVKADEESNAVKAGEGEAFFGIVMKDAEEGGDVLVKIQHGAMPSSQGVING